MQEERTTTRRERMRAATVAEIKQHAWSQVAAGGPNSVSLRAIARGMGMTSSALYRYFTSLDELVSELMADGYESLADALEAAEASLPERDGAGDCFLIVARAYRAWAISHSTEYGLMFGTALCDPDHNHRLAEEHRRGVDVLFRAMLRGIQTGALDPGRLPAPSVALRKQFKRWQAKLAHPLSAEALGGCMFVWAQLHGAISLEIFEQLPEPLLPAADLFDQQMRAVLKLLSPAGAGAP